MKTKVDLFFLGEEIGNLAKGSKTASKAATKILMETERIVTLIHKSYRSRRGNDD